MEDLFDEIDTIQLWSEELLGGEDTLGNNRGPWLKFIQRSRTRSFQQDLMSQVPERRERDKGYRKGPLGLSNTRPLGPTSRWRSVGPPWLKPQAASPHWVSPARSGGFLQTSSDLREDV